MKRIFTCALILALSIGAAHAQTTSTNKQQSHNQEQKMTYGQLNLTDEQKARLKSIREDFRKQMEELNKQDQITVAEMRNRRQALHNQFQSQFEAILTPEQKNQLEQVKTERKGKEGKGFGNRDGNRLRKAGADLQKELNLTPDQQQKVSQIRSNYRTKFETLRNDNTLTQDQKREKLQELRKQQQDEMKQVLTPEQIEKMESFKKQHASRSL